MASPALATIPDEILEEIFLRLPTPAAVACASAVCTSFRRVIKGRAFRRRFRSLHLPPLLGFMDAAGFHPAEAPHPSAPLAGALAPCVADYSFVPPVVSSSSYESFELDEDAVPRWRPRDVRDGRVLLDWISLHPRVVHMWSYLEDGSPEDEDGSDISILMNCTEVVDYHAGARPTWTKRERCNAADFHLAVCDPLFRRFPVDQGCITASPVWKSPIRRSELSPHGDSGRDRHRPADLQIRAHLLETCQCPYDQDCDLLQVYIAYILITTLLESCASEQSQMFMQNTILCACVCLHMVNHNYYHADPYAKDFGIKTSERHWLRYLER